MSSWTFITNFGAVLGLVASHRQITAQEIALSVGITERSVLRIISELEGAGYLQRKKAGRLNTYVVNTDLPLRRPEARGVFVGELLSMLRTCFEHPGVPQFIEGDSSGGSITQGLDNRQARVPFTGLETRAAE